MAVELHHSIEPPGPCTYLPEQRSSLEFRVLWGLTPEEYEAMLERGWRRFGLTYFRPACRACAECISLRIPTATFHPNRSQRRARAACAALRVEVGTPQVDDQRLALYEAWHAWREQARGWEPSPLEGREYAQQFAFPHPCAREVTWWDDQAEGGPRLVALGLSDETPRAWSAVYFFFHPAYARCSPGTANVVLQVELARARGIPYVYLGYRVLGCHSLRYKASFRPHELLQGRPGPEETPRWVPAQPPPPDSEPG